MARSRYSYMGSKVILTMQDRDAKLYNEAIDEWFNAQKRFEAEHGRKITQREVIEGKLRLQMSKAQVRVYNAVADTMNKLIKKGLVLTEADTPEEHLIKVE